MVLIPVKFEGDADPDAGDWSLVELQGTLESGRSSLSGADIGTIAFGAGDKATLTIGHHELLGKRVKLTKLDHESKLARSPLSSGKDADFDAIIPPNQFPPEVWRALVRKGELESTGQGFYKIPLQRRDF